MLVLTLRPLQNLRSMTFLFLFKETFVKASYTCELYICTLFKEKKNYSNRVKISNFVFPRTDCYPTLQKKKRLSTRTCIYVSYVNLKQLLLELSCILARLGCFFLSEEYRHPWPSFVRSYGSVTKKEADTVINWCSEKGLLRPASRVDRGEVTLTWHQDFKTISFMTHVYRSAMHWCRIMEYEQQAGVLGYQARS